MNIRALWAGALTGLLLAGCGGGGSGSGDEAAPVDPAETPPASLVDPSLTQRAVGSTHRLAFAGDARTLGASTCTVDVEVVLTGPGTSVTVASAVPQAADYLVVIPDQTSAKAQARLRSRCNGATASLDEPFQIAASQLTASYVWERVAEHATYPYVDGAGALVFGDRMWLLGGWNPDVRTEFPRTTANWVWSSTDGATWRLDKPNTYDDSFVDGGADWEGRHTAGYTVLGGRMMLFGGDFVSGHYQTDVWSSADGANWTRLPASGATPFEHRLLFGSFRLDDRACIYGGQTLPQYLPDAPIFHSDFWCTTDGMAWQRIATATAPPGRSAVMGEAVLNGEVWIMGGGAYETLTTSRTFMNDVWKSSDLVTWKRVLANAPWDPRIYHNIAVFDNRLWVIAGARVGDALSTNISDAWSSADGFNWYPHTTPWPGRHAATVWVYRDALWLTGGSTGVSGWQIANDVWRMRKSGP